MRNHNPCDSGYFDVKQTNGPCQLELLEVFLIVITPATNLPVDHKDWQVPYSK